MRFDYRVLLPALLGFVLIASPLAAQPQIQPPSGGSAPPAQGGPSAGGGVLINGSTPEQTAEILKAAGYTNVELYKGQSGAQHASGVTSGTTVSAIHTNCKDGMCATVLFLVNFGKQDTIDAAYMNAWHNQKLYSTLYLSQDGSLMLGWAVFLGDTSMSHLRRSAAIYATLVKDLLSFKPGQQ